MRLPLIKQLNKTIEEKGEESLQTTIEVLEQMAEFRGMKDEEIDVLGELLSNMYGAQEVRKSIASGKPEKEALNEFMQRVVGSIDKDND